MEQIKMYLDEYGHFNISLFAEDGEILQNDFLPVTTVKNFSPPDFAFYIASTIRDFTLQGNDI